MYGDGAASRNAVVAAVVGEGGYQLGLRGGGGGSDRGAIVRGVRGGDGGVGGGVRTDTGY